MTGKNEPPSRGIESRFHDLSADVREERLVRYIIHQVDSGRHVKDIINDAYVIAALRRGGAQPHPRASRGHQGHRGAAYAASSPDTATRSARPEARCEGDQDSAGRSERCRPVRPVASTTATTPTTAGAVAAG